MRTLRLPAVASALFVVVLIGGLTITALAQSPGGSKPAVQGVWRIVERTTTDPNGAAGLGTNSNPQPGLYIFTGKHFAQVVDQSPKGKSRPELPDVAKATADQLRAVWNPFVATAGTYEMAGGDITLRTVVTKTPAAAGKPAFATWSYKLEGKDTLVMTQKSNQAGPITTPTTLKFTRIE